MTILITRQIIIIFTALLHDLAVDPVNMVFVGYFSLAGDRIRANAGVILFAGSE